MNNNNKEYELYKSFCDLQSIKPGSNELLLVDSLKNKGLKIVYNNAAYHLLDSISVLSESQIRSGLCCESNTKLEKIEVVFETESTNQQITSHSINNFYSILVAEFQSKGQGRRQKKWCSPLGTNLYFSIQFHLKDTTNTAFIPLIAARSICKALNELGVNNCKIKWPNDIYLDGTKVAGILSESHYCQNRGFAIVVGIGINVNMCSEDGIDQHWTSLKKSQNKSFNRNAVLSTLLNCLIPDFENLSDFNLDLFRQDWNSLDYLKGKIVQVSDEQFNYSALAIGLADDGALIVQHKNKVQKVYSGHISVKPSE